MKIYRDLLALQIPNFTVCGVGNFDGIHLGHQKLIKNLLQCSKIKNHDSLIFTFEPHPSKVLSPNNSAKLIMTLKQKKKVMRSYGIDHFVLAPFTREFSKIKYKNFVYDILIKKCKAKVVVVGYNYRFGYKGEGTAQSLRELCYREDIETVIIPPVTHKGETVSSTFIRSLIKKGDVKNAAEYMGRPFNIEGFVQHGNGIGKKLGFPTANILLEQELILPARGVYAVLVSWKGNIYKGVANLGIKPTFTGNDMRLEIHLFDFNLELYGEKLEVMFIDNLRSEIKFNKAKDLAAQIQRDIINAKKILKSI
ncbi:MAG TPA: bifunctional riboflavin kinase/FAD synthetase [Thermoanaerobacterales bacterium]|nr:bifunctional riboflavin kinase/FAD synthetase [Thermoanaerobacterales bacterium]